MPDRPILVTGAQGFVGRYLTARLLDQDAQCRVIGTGRSARRGDSFTHSVTIDGDSLSAPVPKQVLSSINSAELAGRYRYLPSDLSVAPQLRALLREAQPDLVIHNAAALRDDPSTLLERTNVDGTKNLLEAIGAAAPGCRLILVSSGGVYGKPANLPIAEGDPEQPIDAYSTSKLQAEQLALQFAAASRTPLTIARVFNVVGPGQDERHICGAIAARLTAATDRDDSRELSLGSLHATRDLIDVRDVAGALGILAGSAVQPGVFNIGSGREVSMRKVVETMLGLADPQRLFRVIEGPRRQPDIPRHFADIGNMEEIGFTPRWSLQQSLADVLSYYLRR